MPADRDVERLLTTFFEADPHGASAVYLFGSMARDEAGPRSDIDVAILLAEPPARTFDVQPYGLEGELETYLGGRVDLVALNQAPVDLRVRVQARLDQGMTEDQIVAAGLTRAFDAQVRNPGTSNERFIRQLVQELR